MKGQRPSLGKDRNSVQDNVMGTLADRWAGTPEGGDVSWVLKEAEELVNRVGEARSPG